MIVFSSRAGADVMMFDDVGRRMMSIMGKVIDAKGIVTVEQLPEAIAGLKAAMAAEKAQPRNADTEEEGARAEPAVGLGQRIPPLLELLEISLARGKPVTWGV